MPTDVEISVMETLSAIEIDESAAAAIEAMGNEAVTVVCEAALGTYPGLRPKVRTNATALLGWMNHPQARETVALLVRDANVDVAVRAMRAAGRQRNEQVVESLGGILEQPSASSILAAEAAKALIAVDSPAALQRLNSYRRASAQVLPHRGAPMIQDILSGRDSR